MVRRAWRRALKLLSYRLPVADVPVEFEFCEFDCRKPQCDAEHWQTCARRQMHVARGRALRPEHAEPV